MGKQPNNERQSDQLENNHRSDELVIESPWQQLKSLTSARIALGRAGNSIPTHESLSFQLDHAKAIDAVHTALDIPLLLEQYHQSPTLTGIPNSQPFVVNSKANDRMLYLQRPDLGRQIADEDIEALTNFQAKTGLVYDLAIVIADGLSSSAIQKHAMPVLEQLLVRLDNDETYDWSIAPLTLATQARVASGDDIGEALKAKVTLIFIGERPGLTSPDSMGIYLTWDPKRGCKDSQRNCISNIRPEGFGYSEAADKAYYLLSESLKLQLSGVGLKDRSETEPALDTVDNGETQSFLVVKND
ncbi:ethanolamine ammonia-lyase subunit EutC [Vibrio hippocampi]|uniref:Ethanolamine ammonia-lyase small subunit n=1 Tax=Vibrio hippocampi TaxID=654686 RepID=A0ABM8ZIQ3_9VIBR|nr:ethanolamine ammonia-lyase subunit EutC [Vibrio hippocampi]CAH0525801.1 Ethanolamine ammonia-lyase light chain [Vibrio hippocampi]